MKSLVNSQGVNNSLKGLDSSDMNSLISRTKFRAKRNVSDPRNMDFNLDYSHE